MAFCRFQRCVFDFFQMLVISILLFTAVNACNPLDNLPLGSDIDIIDGEALLERTIAESRVSILNRRVRFIKSRDFVMVTDEAKLVVFDSALRALEEISRGFLGQQVTVDEGMRRSKLKRLICEVSRFSRFFNRHMKLIETYVPSRPLVIINMDGSCFIIAAVQVLLSFSKLKQMVLASPQSDVKTALLNLIEAKSTARGAEYVHQLRNALGTKYMYSHGGRSVAMIRHMVEYLPPLKDSTELLLPSCRGVGMKVRVIKDKQKLLWCLKGNVVQYPRGLLIIALKKDSPDYVPYCPRLINVKDSTLNARLQYRLVATIQRRAGSKERPVGHAWARVAVGHYWYDISGFNPVIMDNSMRVVDAQTACLFYDRVRLNRKGSGAVGV